MKPNWTKEPNPNSYDPPVIKRWETGLFTIEVDKTGKQLRTLTLFDDDRDWPSYWYRQFEAVPKDEVDYWAIQMARRWFVSQVKEG